MSEPELKLYRVEMTGEGREVYEIEAESEDDARANWMHGSLVVSEVFGVEVYSVTEEPSS